MRMSGLRRLNRERGRQALVDGIPFELPVDSTDTSALMAAFPISLAKAKLALPGDEVHPLRFGNKGLLVVTVVDYRKTDIGKYIEFSIAIACTHGPRPAPAFLPLALSEHYGLGQFVVDLPVSTEISVKGGKGIWGMPKHQANLNFLVDEACASSQYDLDGAFCAKIEVRRPRFEGIPLRVSAANFCAFRGMLMKSYIHFTGKVGVNLLAPDAATLTLGDHPRVAALKALEIEPRAVFSAFIPSAQGVLDDYFESWFLSFAQRPSSVPEGLESVVDLGQGQAWLAAPGAPQPPPTEAAGPASNSHESVN